MVLTVQKLEQWIHHALDNAPGAPISSRELVNQAGEWFCSVNSWRFNQRRIQLNIRQSVAFTGAAYTDSSRTVTLASAFDDYTFLAGDILEIDQDSEISGSPLEAVVSSKTDGDNIVLVSALGGDVTSFSGTLPNNILALPGDLRDVIAIATNTDTLPGFRWTDQEDMAYNRVGRRLFENFGLRGAIYGYQTTTGKVEYRLELDPNQSASTDRLEVRYISGWKRVTTDTEELPLPADGWLDGLFTQAVIAWAQGLDAEDEAPLYARLDALSQSFMWSSHVARDGAIQSDMGPIRGSDINRRYLGGRSRYHDISTAP